MSFVPISFRVVYFCRVVSIIATPMPKHLWEALIELSLFFKTLTTSTTTKDMERIEAEMIIILCIIETMFVPVNNDVKNKARVEGSVVNAYLLREASLFCSHYLVTGVPTRNTKFPQNDDRVGHEQPDDNNEILDIFSYPGRHYGRFRNRMLSDEELHDAQTYILLIEDKIKHYIKYLTYTSLLIIIIICCVIDLNKIYMHAFVYYIIVTFKMLFKQ
uniref:DUF4218 domain-containing protein n=1 Tax=Lactuca sativa TaxID=4236 RepID=A0A9R1UR31_LACSA|nr:hypothetical protein LSAT_V11C800424100 [Lactuca sativa]